jgi:two-component system sensor histidine kinase KdpD
MVAVQDPQELAEALSTHVGRSFDCPVAVLLEGRSEPVTTPGFLPDDQTRRAAERALGSGEKQHVPAEAGVSAAAIPLRAARGIIGALAVQHSPGQPYADSQERMLEAFAAQAAVALERAQLATAAHQAQLAIEAERVQDALLHSISHALRTPLSSIIGGLSVLTAPEQAGLSAAARTDILETALEEAERLNGLVSNLLDMTRLQSGHLRLVLDWHDLEDVIGAALGQAADHLKGHPVRIEMAPGLPLVHVDQVLLIQVLDNLLANAAKYSPPDAPIDVCVGLAGQAVEVQVADRGPGVPAPERERIFEKFYRVERPGSPSGTGLGLAICRGIVEALGGEIRAEERDGDGAVFRFTLPILRPEERSKHL